MNTFYVSSFISKNMACQNAPIYKKSKGTKLVCINVANKVSKVPIKNLNENGYCQAPLKLLYTMLI